MKRLSAAVAGMLLAAPAFADTGVGLKAGTLGIGLDLSFPVTDAMNVRANANFYDWNTSLHKSDVDYDAKLRLRTFGLLADWHPWQTPFRLSAGAYINDNKVGLKARPGTGGTVRINGTAYTLSPNDLALDGNVEFNTFAPYVGIGWSTPATKANTWGLYGDLGVLYQQTPSVSLTAVCGPSLRAAGQCATVESNRAAEEERLRNDLKDYRWYPVLSIGVSYAF